MAKFNLTDECLNRAGDTVAATPRGQTPVCYLIYSRGAGMVCGVADIVDLLTDVPRFLKFWHLRTSPP